MPVPFLDLQKQYLSIKKEIDEAIAGVIHTSSFIMGKQVNELEEKIAEYTGTKYAVGLNSGSDALTASLIALGITKGDEVIVPSFTYIATAEAVAIAGAEIVFVDVDPDTYNIDPKDIKNAISKKTKAILPVHLYGQPANMDEIMTIAQEHKLFVIEDAAQAIGAEWDGQKIGSFGDTGCFSFFPTKNLGAYGDGGMVTTNHKDISDFLKKWRIHGQSKKYYTDFVGASSRLDSLQAAILLAKLPHLDSWNAQRRVIAKQYDDALKNTTGITTPKVHPKARHIYHQYTITSDHREKVKERLLNNDIPSMIYYPEPLHTQPPYHTARRVGSLKHAQQLSETVLSLPIYPEMPTEHIEIVSQKITKFFNMRSYFNTR